MLVNNKVIAEETIADLIFVIKKKKELKEVSDDFVRDQLFDYLTKNKRKVSFLVKDFSKKSAKYKQIIKEVRASLRKVYGLFRIEENFNLRKKLVEDLVISSAKRRKELIRKILETHSSTKERLLFYEDLYEKIFKITGKPKGIIDIGCGINPFSIPFMKLRKLNYFAFDLSEEETGLLQKFFNYLQQKNKFFIGKAKVLDVFNWRDKRKADLCFLFKMTDVLDRGKGHKVTEGIVKRIPAKYVVISFATKTMSGKKMTAPNRKWMEWMCRRLGYHYRTLEFSNELFYVIEK